MDTAQQARPLTADEFLAKDQREFGDGWRYELVDGRIIAHAAPTPTHGAIVAGLSAALGTRLRGHAEGCRPEAGSGAATRRRERQMQRFKSPQQAQRFLSSHAMIHGHFRPRRDLMTADRYRRARAKAFRIWRQETCVHGAA